MPFLLVLVLTPPCLQEVWPEPSFGVTSPVRSAVLTWSGMAFAVLVSAVLAWWVRRGLRRDPGQRDRLAVRYGSLRLYHLFALFVFYGLALYVFGWGWTVYGLCAPAALPPPAEGPVPPAPPMLPGAELLILAPILAALLGTWLCSYDAERALHDAGRPLGGSSYLGRWQYVAHQARHNLFLVFLAVGLLVLLKSFRWLFPGDHQGWSTQTSLLAAVAALAAFTCMPWALRLVLGLKPMPAGPMRERLEAAAKRLHFRCSDFLVWNTRGGVVNALVVGILPVLRYVVFTDRLLTDLTPEEVEAVFGHEVGHVKHRHMAFYLGFLMVSMTVVWAAAAIWVLPYFNQVPTLQTREDLALLLVMTLLAVYIFVVFGYVSRRCERQADIYGCRAVSCDHPFCNGHDPRLFAYPRDPALCRTGISIFISALEKVADLNGISRDKPGWLQSWQHSTIARRVDFLKQMREDPSLEPRFQQRTALVKWGLLLSLAAVLLVLGSVYGWDRMLL